MCATSKIKYGSLVRRRVSSLTAVWSPPIAWGTPACIAFIVLSSSLLGLIKGKVSPMTLLEIGLIVLMSLISLVYRRLKGSQATGVDAE